MSGSKKENQSAMSFLRGSLWFVVNFLTLTICGEFHFEDSPFVVNF